MSNFDVEKFRVAFPAFANPLMYPSEGIIAASELAGCYINVASKFWKCANCSQTVWFLITAHLLMINGTTGMPGVGYSGLLTNATVGSVSVGFSASSVEKPALISWLGKTPYGEQLVALWSRLTGGIAYIGGSPERRGFRKIGGRF
jgi:hypothetical protein